MRHVGQTDMMKLTVAFRSFTNVPKNEFGLCSSGKETRNICDINHLMLSGYSVLA